MTATTAARSARGDRHLETERPQRPSHILHVGMSDVNHLVDSSRKRADELTCGAVAAALAGGVAMDDAARGGVARVLPCDQRAGWRLWGRTD
jgi:hypothetical protein